METLFAGESQQGSMPFPMPLVEQYKPRKIQDFAGLAKVKKICTTFAAAPREACLLFVGDAGCGKSSMARAVAAAVGAEVHTVNSAECRLDVLENLCRINAYVPLNGGWHCNILEEFDACSDAAGKFLLSRLDGTCPCPKTFWICTANSLDRLEERLISRCLVIRFDGYGSGSDCRALLERIWAERAPAEAEAPDFKRLCSKNIRQAIQSLELEIMAAS